MIQTRTERISFPARGQINSSLLNELVKNLVYDIVALASGNNALETNATNSNRETRDDFISLRGEIEDLKADALYRKKIKALDSESIRTTISMYDLTKLSFLSGASSAVRASVAPLYGQATVPVNGIQQKFIVLDYRTNEVIPPATLTTTVTGTFDKLDGEGSIDHEQSGAITEGDITLAFNGMNTSRWVRQVSFSLNSDVDTVECELVVTVPSQTNQQSNCLILHPHPWGEVDITHLAIASDLGGTFTSLPGFVEVKGARYLRYFFPAQNVAQIRIRLHQRNWRQLNGLKSFRYGLEELGLQLVDWDKTWDGAAAVSANHTMVHTISAPDNFNFDKIEGFWSIPDFTDEDAGLRHLHFKIAKDIAGTDVIWNSDSMGLPQDSNITVSGTYPTLYVLTTLNWVETSGGSDSPFSVGVTPFLNSIGIKYSTKAVV